ncbi:MAG: Ppx/GppA phosphatase family protein [Gemmatimonadota bacterium]|nr:Ppx/GppA phosphatase family protein [Gemmatimonadota bacterium]
MNRRMSAAARETTADAAEFPIRVAAIDVGSNAIRFVAAEFSDATHHTQLVYERVPVRLGHSAFVTGELHPDAMDQALEAFHRFRAEIDRLGVTTWRAVATSAVRESRNGAAFAKRILDETGITLGLISGGEEARLVWSAVRNRIPMGTNKWMLVDLGGGSVEVSLADDAGIMWSESHTMGSVRLLEELAGVDDAPGHFSMLLAEYASTLRIPAAAKHWTPVELIATGGNIETLARLAGSNADELLAAAASGIPAPLAEPSTDEVLVITRADLRHAIDLLSRLSYAQRVGQLGLREDRADVILPAAIVYDRVAELAGAERIFVPGVGVKEGVLLDLIEERTSDRGLGRHERIVREGALTLGRRYLFDEEHARHVANLATTLFDQLTELHGLAPEDRLILIAGALLHDIGQHISYSKHHKHSMYLILHAEIAGVSPSELPLVALVARYHRRADPREEHYVYCDLSPEDRERVSRLAALLRVADSLDREHLQRVHALEAVYADGAVDLRLSGEGPLLLEQWALRKKGKLFDRVFGVPPRVTLVTPPLDPALYATVTATPLERKG